MNLKLHHRTTALDLARTLAWRARIIRLRGQSIRVIPVATEDGRYAPALILDATTDDLELAERTADRLNGALVDLIREEARALDERIAKAEASQ